MFSADGLYERAPLIPRSEPSIAGRTTLRVRLDKLGRFVVKCLSDAAIDSTMMWF
jgi:hypothetical protein